MNFVFCFLLCTLFFEEVLSCLGHQSDESMFVELQNEYWSSMDVMYLGTMIPDYCDRTESRFYISGCRDDSESVCNSLNGKYFTEQDTTIGHVIQGYVPFEEVVNNCSCVEKTITANGDVIVLVEGVAEHHVLGYDVINDVYIPQIYYGTESFMILLEKGIGLGCSVEVDSPLEDAIVAIVERRDYWNLVELYIAILTPKGDIYDGIQYSIESISFPYGANAEFVEISETNVNETYFSSMYNVQIVRTSFIPPNCMGFEWAVMTLELEAYLPLMEKTKTLTISPGLSMDELCDGQIVRLLKGGMNCSRSQDENGDGLLSPNEMKEMDWWVDSDDIEISKATLTDLSLHKPGGLLIKSLISNGILQDYAAPEKTNLQLQDVIIGGPGNTRATQVFSFRICKACTEIWDAISIKFREGLQLLVKLEVEVEYDGFSVRKKIIKEINNNNIRRSDEYSPPTETFGYCLEVFTTEEEEEVSYFPYIIDPSGSSTTTTTHSTSTLVASILSVGLGMSLITLFICCVLFGMCVCTALVMCLSFVIVLLVGYLCFSKCFSFIKIRSTSKTHPLTTTKKTTRQPVDEQQQQQPQLQHEDYEVSPYCQYTQQLQESEKSTSSDI